MSSEPWKQIKVVIELPGSGGFERLEKDLLLPRDAELDEFLEALKTECPEIYGEVRRCVLRAAGRVLAYGKEDPLFRELDRRLAEGGTIVFEAGEGQLASVG